MVEKLSEIQVFKAPDSEFVINISGSKLFF